MGSAKEQRSGAPALIFPCGWKITFHRSSSSHVLQNHFYSLYLCLKVVQMYRFTCFISIHAEDCGEKWGHLVTIRQLFLLSRAAECHIWILLLFFIAELVHSFRSRTFHQMPYTYLVWVPSGSSALPSELWKYHSFLPLSCSPKSTHLTCLVRSPSEI